MSRFGITSIEEIQKTVANITPKNTGASKTSIWKQFEKFCKERSYDLNALQSAPQVPEVKVVPMVNLKHATEYNMKHKNRGKALIFNHEEFEANLSTRRGTHVDAERLKNTLEKLHFDVEVHNDLEFGDLKKILRNTAASDHSENDCLLIAVFSHGRSSEIAAKDIHYPAEMLWNPFTADSCVSLAGKPKIFLINACRGNQVDAGVRVVGGHTQTDSASEESQSYKIPKYADFLYAHSTTDGYYSFRSPEDGTWFIQCLCEVLEEYHEKHDLLKMLTTTARKVAVDFTSYNPDILEQHDMTQVPSITTSLIREVYFRAKM